MVFYSLQRKHMTVALDTLQITLRDIGDKIKYRDDVLVDFDAVKSSYTTLKKRGKADEKTLAMEVLLSSKKY